MSNDPIFAIAAMVIIGAIGGLNLIGRRIKQEFMADAPMSQMERDAKLVYESLPLSVRTNLEMEEKMVMIGTAIIHSAASIDDLAQSLNVLFSHKKGRKKDPVWIQTLESLESQVEQPQRYHAVELAGSGWAVAYFDESGEEVVASTCDDEWGARIDALRQNAHNPERPSDLPIQAYVDMDMLRRHQN